jgi:hypothetical protein
MHFNSGTRLGVFVVDQADIGATTLFDVIEGPREDEITLESTYVMDGRPSGFTFSVQTALLPDMTSAYFDNDEWHSILDAIGAGGANLFYTAGDERGIAAVTNDLYERGHALIALRDGNSGEQIARIAAIRGDEGFVWIPVAIVVVGVTLIVTKHRENIVAIERCVPIENELTVTVTRPDGSSLTTSSVTRVHKTEER